MLNFQVDETTVDRLVEVALEHRMASVKLRYDLDPALQPILQGSLDRQLSRRHGNRDGFVARHHASNVLLLCVSRMMMKNHPRFEGRFAAQWRECHHRGLDIWEVGRRDA